MNTDKLSEDTQGPSKKIKPELTWRDKLPPRPLTVQHQDGKVTKLLTNWFPVKLSAEYDFYEYLVVFEPPVENRRQKQAILHECQNSIGKFIPAGETIYATKDLGGTTTLIKHKSKPNRPDAEEKSYDITLTNVSGGKINPIKKARVMESIYNNLFKKLLRTTELEQMGRNFFNPKAQKTIENLGLAVWPGFATALRDVMAGLLLNVDLTYKIVHEKSIYELVTVDKMDFEELKDKIVMTRYNYKTYRLVGVEYSLTPSSTFDKRNGDKITFGDYFAQQYKLIVRDKTQPMLRVKDTRRSRVGQAEPNDVYLIPEFTYLTGLTEAMRSDFGIMREVHSLTRQDPTPRLNQLASFIKYLSDPNSQRTTKGGNKKLEKLSNELKEWDMTISADPQKVTGWIYNPEDIYFEDTSRPFKPHFNRPADWTNALKGDHKLIAPKPLDNWLIVYRSRDYSLVDQFYRELSFVAAPMGIDVREPQYAEVQSDNPEQWLRAIKSNVTPRSRIVLIVLPTNQADRYNQIKKQLILETPVPSQCIVVRTLNKKGGMRSVCTKVIQQMMVKAGGQLWTVKIPLKGTMVVGIDVCHDSVHKAKSVLGFTATMNEQFTLYNNQAHLQPKDQEISSVLHLCMKNAIQKFAEKTGHPPIRIIVYRDGVGESQTATVVELEAPGMQEAIDETYKKHGAKPPEFAMIIVRKRINTRFFEFVRPGEVKNPSPGTIVDQTIVNRTSFDFFLISQFANQGTVSPTYYLVVKNNTLLTPNHLQHLSFKLCHLFYNWSGTISVPAPCQYAHRIAFLVAKAIHEKPHAHLQDFLFYL